MGSGRTRADSDFTAVAAVAAVTAVTAVGVQGLGSGRTAAPRAMSQREVSACRGLLYQSKPCRVYIYIYIYI